jgi:diaminohydroxyphosphoribosylaminopyrimidine deaminase/5-amino-6-(5-phosphoribosylamino)uracil reductase
MRRCLQLAECGKNHARPNPMVGAVIVCNNKIIGEGYHRQYGYAHAEVNAVNSVKDKSLLPTSVIYVSLEPCSHYGKTPPCAKLIIDSKIPKVVIATVDPDPQVAGNGIKMLQEAGVEVATGILEEEAKNINKNFFTRQIQKRPYIYLKWAQTSDGFIDRRRAKNAPKMPTPISNSYTKMLVHKKRTEVAAIMIGTNTAINDNPQLTSRLWYGENPIRIVLDKNLRIPKSNNLFDGSVPTLVFTEQNPDLQTVDNVNYIQIPFNEMLLFRIMDKLTELKIESLLVEGGKQLLESFIHENLWDEAFIEIAATEFGNGIEAPQISGKVNSENYIYKSKTIHLSNPENYKLL